MDNTVSRAENLLASQKSACGYPHNTSEWAGVVSDCQRSAGNRSRYQACRGAGRRVGGGFTVYRTGASRRDSVCRRTAPSIERRHQ